VSAGREKAVTALGADVIRTRGTYDDSVRIAANVAAREGWTEIADTSTSTQGTDTRIPLLVMEGYRVLAMESLEQLRAAGVSRPSHVFLQAGVGGLAAAMVAHLWTEFGAKCPTFIVVEPETADCLHRSATAGRPSRALGNLNTLMAGLACGEVSQIAWPILQARVDAFITLSDAAAVDTMRALAAGALGAPPLVAGESGVAGLAGLLALPPNSPAWRDLGLNSNSQVLVIGTEGATDPSIWQALVGRPIEAIA
jgi:diaminopropionate ammonia-lyase